RDGIVINGVGLSSRASGMIGTDGGGIPGRDLHGFAINSFYIHGSGVDGPMVNGLVAGAIGLSDRPISGLVINGSGGNGLRINRRAGAFIEPVELSPEQEEALETALHHLIGCALAPGQVALIMGSDGLPVVYQGVRGLAPGWLTGALTQSGEEAVRACLESSPVAVVGLALNEDQEASLITLLRYMIECALDSDDQAVVYAGDGEKLFYSGVLGLAPEWRDGPMSAVGQRAVSACLAARSNALEQPVVLSLRGAGLEVGATERDLFGTYEGAFWADLFASEQYVETCKAEGAGLSGRSCAEGDDCGFVHRGVCATVCSESDEYGEFSACSGRSEVISVFLSLGWRSRSSDADSSCLIGGEGEAWCWGENSHGQLGDGTTAHRTVPTQVVGLGSDVAELSQGKVHTCARKRDGSLWCWGKNNRGQLGEGGPTVRDTPGQVIALGEDVASAQAGRRHTCAIKTDSSVWCWGDNGHGQLGVGSELAYRASPAPVAGLPSGAARLSSSTHADHQCAIEPSGGLWCWGKNHRGQLGDGTVSDSHWPVAVDSDVHDQDFGDITDVCASRIMTCARKSDGSLWCWGRDADRPARHELDDDLAVVHGGLACGARHVCVMAADTTVWCMGSNKNEQLGYAGDDDFATSFEPVMFMDDVSVVTAGRDHTCATRSGGDEWCWGGNGGGLFPHKLGALPIAMPWILCDDGLCAIEDSGDGCPLDSQP
ncbi:MAG: hypothetical protein AAGC55_00460, partial [Myxococcota bacterium]